MFAQEYMCEFVDPCASAFSSELIDACLSHESVAQLKPKVLIGKRESRERILLDDELRAVWNAAGEMGYTYGLLFRLLILRGQREREVVDMRWAEVDFIQRMWTIRAERMKGGSPAGARELANAVDPAC